MKIARVLKRHFGQAGGLLDQDFLNYIFVSFCFLVSLFVSLVLSAFFCQQTAQLVGMLLLALYLIGAFLAPERWKKC